MRVEYSCDTTTLVRYRKFKYQDFEIRFVNQSGAYYNNLLFLFADMRYRLDIEFGVTYLGIRSCILLS